MNRDEMRAVVLDTLGEIAPDLDASAIDAAADLQRDLDLDSLDFFNFIVALSERLAIDVPERDYRELATLDRCLDYLAAHAPTPA
jgi:acyl carrier protein